MPVHAVLERLASVDENDGHLIVVFFPQLRVEVDVHIVPLEVGIALKLLQRLLDDVAEMTTLARIDHHVVHRAIVDACPKIHGSQSRRYNRGSLHLPSDLIAT